MRSGSAAAIRAACAGSSQLAIKTGTRSSGAGIGVPSRGFFGHRLGQPVAEPRARAERAPGDVAVGLILVPVAAGDVEVDPRPPLDELTDEHRGCDHACFSVIGVLQVRALTLDQLSEVGVDWQPPDPVSSSLPSGGHLLPEAD